MLTFLSREAQNEHCILADYDRASGLSKELPSCRVVTGVDEQVSRVTVHLCVWAWLSTVASCSIFYVWGVEGARQFINKAAKLYVVSADGSLSIAAMRMFELGEHLQLTVMAGFSQQYMHVLKMC